MTQTRQRTKRLRPFSAALAAAALIGALFPALLDAPALAAANPSGVSFTLEGCREPAIPSNYNPNATPPDLVCADSEYTTGNLGKNWEELDLVPHRLTARAGNRAPAQYTVAVVADYMDANKPGYDVMSPGVLNTTKSTGTCSLDSQSANQQVGPVNSGTDESVYRLYTITQSAKSVCVFDYVERLAVNSHLYPGSSLHSNKANGDLTSMGSADVPLPVNEIEPQTINATPSASQNAETQWSIAKSATPANVALGDTCAVTGAEATGTATITVEWTKLSVTPSGLIDGHLLVKATNPSSRNLKVTATSELYGSGTAGAWGTGTAGPASLTDVALNAHATDQTIIDSNFTMASGPTEISTRVRATYKVVAPVSGENVDIPGYVEDADEHVTVQNGSNTNSTVSVGDVERLFASTVTTDADTPPAASFDPTAAGLAAPAQTKFAITALGAATTVSGTLTVTGGGAYSLGTKTTGPVFWASGNQTASGKVVFNKTLYLTKGYTETSKLYDKATLSSGATVLNTAKAQVTTSSSANRTLTISKSQTLTFTSGKTFTFHVMSGTTEVATPTITIPATQSGPLTTTVSNLGAGTYTINEDATAPYGTQTQNVTFTPPSCAETASFTNQAAPATARVRKVLVSNDITGDTSWVMTLTGPGGISETKTVTGAIVAGGYTAFDTLLEVDGGTYTITETQHTNWDPTSVAGDLDGATNRVTTAVGPPTTCSITLNLSTDDGAVLSCTFTNTERGRARVTKTSQHAPVAGTDVFEFQLRKNATPSSNGTLLDTQYANASNGGALLFAPGGNSYLVPGTYQVCEYVGVGWDSTLADMAGAFVPGTNGDTQADNTYVCVNITVAAGATNTLTVDNTPPPGGMAKTIGYWKNHASCASSNGKQDPVLDWTIGIHTLTFGLLNITSADCTKAVSLLNKTPIDSTKKAASDPVFNVVAQLVAYDLNQLAGAGQCAASTTAAAALHAKLIEIGFNGSTYTKPTTKAGLAALAALMNGWNTTLDSYNNNTLC